jgi:hypothetical protein
MTGINPFTNASSDDSGQVAYPSYAVSLHTSPMPMRIYNGSEGRKADRLSPETDVDFYPYPIRRYTNMSVTDVQINNGLRWRVAAGKRINYRGAGYLWTSQPLIPGQTRDNAAGFHRRGPSPYNVQDVVDNGPGAQPEHPGGPGKIAALTFINPMSG